MAKIFLEKRTARALQFVFCNPAVQVCLLQCSLEIGPLEEVFVGLNMWLICCQISRKCIGLC